MLDPIVVRPSHKGRWSAYLLVLPLVAGALASIVVPCREAPPPTVVVAIAPAPIAVPPAPPPPPAPAPPAPVSEPPPPPPQVVNTACVADVATVGSPAGELEEFHQLEGAAIVRGSCVLAAWTTSALRASWDGGQTFAAVEVPDGIVSVYATNKRIAVVSRRKQLGLLYPGAAAIAWRPLSESLGEPDLVLYIVKDHWIAAGGAARFAASDDDGKTWRYVESPAATERWNAGRLDDIREDGTLSASAYELEPSEPYWGDPSQTIPVVRYEARISDGRWRTTDRPAALPRVQAQLTGGSGWTYAIRPDRFWGCGASSKIVAIRGAREITIAGDLRSDIYPFGIGGTRTAAFALHDEKLFRLVGGTARDLGVHVDMDTQLVGVDRYDTPIFQQANRLLRWSERTGWRVLVSLPAR